MDISLKGCVKSFIDKTMYYGQDQVNNTANNGKVIKYLTLFAPPFVSAHFKRVKNTDIPIGTVCGPLMKLLEQMSIKYGYR